LRFADGIADFSGEEMIVQGGQGGRTGILKSGLVRSGRISKNLHWDDKKPVYWTLVLPGVAARSMVFATKAMTCPKCGHHEFTKTVPGMNYPDEWWRNIRELMGRHRLVICEKCGAIVDSEAGKMVDHRIRPAVAYVAVIITAVAAVVLVAWMVA
jgi:hypothetical protein